MAIVDKKTPRLGLLLPNADNFLQDDVERLIDSFGLLDVLVVMRDQATGKIADDQLSAVIARLDAQGKLSTATLPSSVVQKGADGKIDASVLPSIAIIDSYPVPNEASMLGLQCERGDIAIRTDLGRSYILSDMPPSKLSNWRELTSTNVTSVNGQVGAITGLAKSGVNDDITQLTALSGPLRLGGEAAGDYDAVTLKQLRAASGGAGGASMNGVMNNFIGAVEWFNGTRAKLPAGYIAADGQLLTRVSTPDLWAAVDSGMLISLSEALWMNSGDAGAANKNRGRYSTGDGSTTFRVPDLNGSSADGVAAAFLRGDAAGRVTELGAVGQMFLNGAPNVSGTVWSTIATSEGSPGGDSGGAIFWSDTKSGGRAVYQTTNPANTGSQNLRIDASKSSPAYGRLGTNEVRPNYAVGIWIIRASGLFQAQNTVFNVLTSDTTTPGQNTQVAGGKIGSRYSISGVDQIEGQMWSEKTVGETEARLVLSAANLALNLRSWMSFSTAGNLTITGEYRGATSALSGISKARSFQPSAVGYDPGIYKSSATASPDANGVNCIYGVTGIDSSTYCYQIRIPNQSYQHVWRLDHDGTSEYFSIRSDKKMYTPIGAVAIEGSDVRIKDGFEPADESGSWNRIKAVGVCDFTYSGQQSRQRGFIAQQMAYIDPFYVFEGGTGTDANGSTFEILNVNSKAVMADVVMVIQQLQGKVEALESELMARQSN